MKQLFLVISFCFTISSFTFSQADVKSLADLGNDLVNLGNYKAAMEKFDEALDYLPSYAPAIEGKANLLVTMEEYKAAGKIIEDAIKKNSDYAPFYLINGIVKIRKGKHKDAIEDLNRALDLAQGENDKIFENKVLVNRGAAYQKLLEFDAALNDYSSAIKLNSNNPNIFMYRGYLYYQIENYEDALNDFNKVIEIDPQNPFAFYNRGMIYLKQVDDNKACSDFHRACELGNNNACRMVVSRCIDLE